MYVYADGTAYKGTWNADVLDSTLHPFDSASESDDAKRLHEINLRHAEAVYTLKQRMPTDKKSLPPVPRPLPS